MKKIFIAVAILIFSLLNASLRYNNNPEHINTEIRSEEIPDLRYYSGDPVYLWYNTAPEDKHYWAQEFVVDDFFRKFSVNIPDSLREESFTLKRVRFYSLFNAPAVKFNFFIDDKVNQAKENVNLLPDHYETADIVEGWNELLLEKELIGLKFFVTAQIITDHVSGLYIAGTDGTGERSYYYRNSGGSSSDPFYQFSPLGDYGFKSDFVFDAFGDYSLKKSGTDIPVVVIKNFYTGREFAPGTEYQPKIILKNQSSGISEKIKVKFDLNLGNSFFKSDGLPLQSMTAYEEKEFYGFTDEDSYTVKDEVGTYQLRVTVSPQDSLSQEERETEFKSIFKEAMPRHLLENFLISDNAAHNELVLHENSVEDTSIVIMNFYPDQGDIKYSQAANSRFSFYKLFSYPDIAVNGNYFLKNKHVTEENIDAAIDSLAKFKTFVAFDRDSLKAAYSGNGTAITAKIPLKSNSLNILPAYYEKSSFHAVLTERDSLDGEFIGNTVIHQFTPYSGIEGIALDTLNTFFSFSINPLNINFHNATVNSMAEKTDIWFWYQAEDQILYLNKINYSEIVALANDPVKILNISIRPSVITEESHDDSSQTEVYDGLIFGAAIERDGKLDYSDLKIHFNIKSKSDPSYNKSKQVTLDSPFEGTTKFIVSDSLFTLKLENDISSDLRVEVYLDWNTTNGETGESAFNSVYFFTVNGVEHEKIMLDMFANRPFENIQQMSEALALAEKYNNIDVQALFLNNSIIPESEAAARISELGFSVSMMPGLRVNGNFYHADPNAEELEASVSDYLSRTTFVEEDLIEAKDNTGDITVIVSLKNPGIPVYEERLRRLRFKAAVTVDTLAYGNNVPEYYMNLIPEGIPVEFLSMNTAQEFQFSLPTDPAVYSFADDSEHDLDLRVKVHYWLEDEENNSIAFYNSLTMREVKLLRKRFENVPPSASLKLYPNPFDLRHLLRIDFTADRSVDKASVSVYNIKGQKVNEFSKEIRGRSGTLIWNGKNLKNKNAANGIYFMKIKIEADKKTKTYVKKCLLLK
ncbi:MAG: hypothetical protein CSB55_03715 [Candidatus Cloacimonadota bacterium]|nr:MAG: hypothetical protein CSB55_03715 [Candidatus Cloacimonadota bacterium]